MPQSSLTAWLKKPAPIKQPPAVAPGTDQKPSIQAHEQLPTPPSSSQEVHEHDDHASQGGLQAPSETVAPTTALRSTRPHLPPNVRLRACTEADFPAFKRLNQLLLPIPYPESFYREILEDSLTNNITLLATWHDDAATIGNEKGRLVGAIRCRLFAHPPQPAFANAAARSGKGTEKPMLYLSTLVLLSPYRSYGIATAMLQQLTTRAVKAYGIESVGAHVWEANEEGLDWYRKRGFKELGREEGYYRKLKPQGAVVMKRDVGVMDLLEEH